MDEKVEALDEQWNLEEANRLVRNALVEIDALAERIEPGRAGPLLNEFERDIQDGILLKSLVVVRATCEEYGRRFRALIVEK